ESAPSPFAHDRECRRTGGWPDQRQKGRELACEWTAGRPSTEPRVGLALLSFANTRSSSEGSVSETLPFSCPFVATNSGKRQQGATQSEGRESRDSMGDGARSGNFQHTAAKDG